MINSIINDILPFTRAHDDNYTLSINTITVHLYIDTYEFPVHMLTDSNPSPTVSKGSNDIERKKEKKKNEKKRKENNKNYFFPRFAFYLLLKSCSLVFLASIPSEQLLRTFEIVYACVHFSRVPRLTTYVSFFTPQFLFTCICHEAVEIVCPPRSYVFVYINTDLFFN